MMQEINLSKDFLDYLSKIEEIVAQRNNIKKDTRSRDSESMNG